MAEEANDVKESVEIETTTTESSSEETNDDGVIALGQDNEPEEVEEETTLEPDADQTSTTEESNDPEPSNDAPRKNAETRKQQLNNEIRDKVAERNALRKEIAELNRQKYQIKNESDLPTVDAMMNQVNPETGDYYTRTEAKLARIEAERELEQAQRRMDEYTETIVDNRLRISDEANQALKDFPIFDSESSSYNQALTEQADRIVENMILRDEKTGEVLGARGSIYDVYSAIANAARSAEVDGKIAGRQAALDMANSADVVGSTAPKTTDEDDDPFLKGFMRANH